MNRVGGQIWRECRLTKRRLEEVASQHAAVGVLARHARAGFLPVDRAIVLIEAIVEGHAIPHWIMELDKSARLTITANPDAPPEILAMLENEPLPTIDRASDGGWP